jgi:hypothetical protein
MFKLLRNFALAGLLVAGIMKLLAWWVVGRDAEHVIAALAPYATVKYDGISAGLDGTISLDQVSVDAGHHVYRADSVTFEAPSLFWLFGHALFGGSELPAQFSLYAEGLKLPPVPWLDPKLFDPVTFVPFPAAGCGDGLSDADYHRIGNVPAQTHERLDYRYDAAQHTLNLVLNLQAPGFSKIDIAAELKRFDPAAMAKASMWDHAHLEQVAATYTDLDYLARRNQFCAQRTHSANPAQFIERHISAAQELLKAKRAEPSGELVQLYRTLLEHGGHVGMLSLPSAGFVIANLHGAPEELLRQLNVTARYQDKPPIMFRVAFAPTPQDAAAATAEPAVAVVSTSTAAAPAPVTSAPTDAPPAPITSSPAPPAAPTAVAVAPKPTAVSAAVAPPTPVPIVAAANPAPTATPTPAAVTPASPKSNEATAPAKATRDNLGLHLLDREEARLAAITPPLAPPPKRDAKPMLGATLGPSAAAPPDATLAMVWKPAVFEPLPESGPEQKNYDVIDIGRLGAFVGRYVQVITEGGKKIGGLVLGVDDAGVKLQVNRNGGNITFVVTKTRVQEIRLPHY